MSKDDFIFQKDVENLKNMLEGAEIDYEEDEHAYGQDTMHVISIHEGAIVFQFNIKDGSLVGIG